MSSNMSPFMNPREKTQLREQNCALSLEPTKSNRVEENRYRSPLLLLFIVARLQMRHVLALVF